MPSQSSSNQVIKSPLNTTGASAKPTRAAGDMPRPKDARFIEKLEVKPSNQRRITLGDYTQETPPKGFLIELSPDPSPADSVDTKITGLVDAGHYTLHLHVANRGTKAVRLDVWQL